MKALYLTKQCPSREYTISDNLIKFKEIKEIDSCVFSRRIFLDLNELNDTKRVFNNIYDFTSYYLKCNHDNLDIDKELYKFQLDYKLPVNEILYADRLIINYSEDKRKKVIYSLIKFAIKMIEDNSYDVIIGELSSSSDLIFYYLSKYFGIKYIFFWHGRISNKMEFTNISGQRIGLLELYNKYKDKGIKEEEKSYLNEYYSSLLKESTPDYMKFSKETKFKNLFKKIYIENSNKRIKKYLASYRIDVICSADQSPKINDKLYKKAKKIVFPIKSRLLCKYYDNVDLRKKYYLVPLHFQPESSTMTFATYYLNQIAFIENLSKAIPGGTYLYVKEHPAMFANRRIDFYRQLKKIPNVKLVHPDYKMNELINNSSGVITLTNTTGYEAIIADRPVFVFGNVFYNDYDYAYMCNNFIDFKQFTLKAIEEWDKLRNERLINRDYFILASLKSLREANLNSHIFDNTFFKEENVNNIVININEQLRNNL